MHLPERAPWVAPYLAELTAFRTAKHDDQVDSTAQMLDWFKGAAASRAASMVIRTLAKELPDRKPTPYRLAGFRRW